MQLKDKLAQANQSRLNSVASSGSALSAPTINNQQTFDVAGGIALPRASLSMMNMISPEIPDGQHPQDGTPQLSTAAKPNKIKTDPFMDLLFSGWNPDLPEPAVLGH